MFCQRVFSLGFVSLLGQNVQLGVHETVLGKSEKKAKRRQFPMLLTRVTSACANGIISDFLTLSAQPWPRGGLQRHPSPASSLSFQFWIPVGGGRERGHLHAQHIPDL